MRCPLLNKDCIEAKCAWWATYWMRSKPDESPVAEQDCVVRRLPSMMIELIRNTGGVAAAVESSRNETVKRQDQFLSLVQGTRLIR